MKQKFLSFCLQANWSFIDNNKAWNIIEIFVSRGLSKPTKKVGFCLNCSSDRVPPAVIVTAYLTEIRKILAILSKLKSFIFCYLVYIPYNVSLLLFCLYTDINYIINVHTNLYIANSCDEPNRCHVQGHTDRTFTIEEWKNMVAKVTHLIKYFLQIYLHL